MGNQHVCANNSALGGNQVEEISPTRKSRPYVQILEWSAATHDDDRLGPIGNVDLDALAKNDPYMLRELQQDRQEALGLADESIQNFINSVQFVSLGSYCVVSSALQALGFRRFSYPFDWVRSPLTGVERLFRTNFSGFFSGTPLPGNDSSGGLTRYFHTAWGGSFWHHDISDPETRAAMQRRVDRILAKREVPTTKPHVFVRAANCTTELPMTLGLYDALQAVYSAGIYLLVLVEGQEKEGPIGIRDNHRVLLYRVHKSFGNKENINERARGYWTALAFATKLWSGEELYVPEAANILEVAQFFDPMDAGDPACELFSRGVWTAESLRAPGPSANPPPRPVLREQKAAYDDLSEEEDESAIGLGRIFGCGPSYEACSVVHEALYEKRNRIIFEDAHLLRFQDDERSVFAGGIGGAPL